MKPVYITGHKNPDTDSIMAAIAYAHLKKITGEKEAIPVRLGEINAESKFVLEKFGLEEPKLIESVKTQVRDLDIKKISPIRDTMTVNSVVGILNETSLGSLPVVDKDGTLLGMVTISDIAKMDINIADDGGILKAGLNNINDVIGGQICNAIDEKIQGKVTTAFTKEEFENNDEIILTVLQDNTKQLIQSSKAKLIIVCNCEEELKSNTNLITTQIGIFKASRLISQAIKVKNVMSIKNVISFKEDEYLDDVKETIVGTRFRNFPVVDEENKLCGIITRDNLIKYDKKRVILVDHNEKAQSVPGIDQAVVEEIIDHHRLADIETSAPLYMRSEPVGSSNTIIASIYKEKGIVPDVSIAGAMLCAILSDTVLFKSPTCTALDKEMANYLAEITDVSIDEIGNDLFTAGSTLVNEGAKAMVERDFKEFNLGLKKLGIGQITIWDTELVKPVQQEIKDYIQKLIDTKGYDAILFMETSIKNEGTLLVCAGEYEDFVTKAFGAPNSDGEIYLDGVMSRKKQIVPPVTNILC